ncbi:hypothetical protein [Lacrimispora sp.]|uniref:hypothetical protein n=1 Tax=Lacrimispora sp. TaxID=2719234 RepID=UPI0039928617
MMVEASSILLPEKKKVLEVQIYREQLLRYLDDYQIRLNNFGLNLDKDEHKWVKLIVCTMGDLSDKKIQESAHKAYNNLGDNARRLVSKYLRKIMLMIGNICECIIIDNCKRKTTINIKCINYACFKEDINTVYDIAYDEYTPFSPSHSRIVMVTEHGIVSYKPNLFVNEPNHVNKDIIWCNKKHNEKILQARIPYTEYEQMARLQIKSSTHYKNIGWNEEKYRFSPIIYFDLNRDINELYGYLASNNSNLYVRSIMDFDYDMMNECNWYFKLLAGHFSGMFDIRDFNSTLSNSLDNGIMKYIFRSDIKSLLNKDSIIKSEQLVNGLQDFIISNNNQIKLDEIMV